MIILTSLITGASCPSTKSPVARCLKPGSQYDAGASVDGDAGNRLDFYLSVGQRDVPLANAQIEI